MENSKLSYLQATKKILRYIKGTIDCGLFYPTKENLKIASFNNYNWVGCYDDKKKVQLILCSALHMLLNV